MVTLDFDWSNGLSKDDDLGEVVEDNDYDWSDKKSIVLLEKSFLEEKSILLFELEPEAETGLNRLMFQMFHNPQNQFDLMMILEFGNLKKKFQKKNLEIFVWVEMTDDRWRWCDHQKFINWVRIFDFDKKCVGGILSS